MLRNIVGRLYDKAGTDMCVCVFFILERIRYVIYRNRIVCAN